MKLIKECSSSALFRFTFLGLLSVGIVYGAFDYIIIDYAPFAFDQAEKSYPGRGGGHLVGVITFIGAYICPIYGFGWCWYQLIKTEKDGFVPYAKKKLGPDYKQEIKDDFFANADGAWVLIAFIAFVVGLILVPIFPL